ncbi:hypothetical protein SAY86_004468 [Trapa natans]|uniref:HMA domain-containing protein n=1 Tax=Trapa natans TaxID=22666 RepID=A0AAN7N4L2_TRANT|nr:hypothetical protein SAY86_004468 [Trapa natans]
MNKKQGNARNQICVLRVNIHCDGCKKKVNKLLQKIEGVDATLIDAELGKVTISGYVHPKVLIDTLVKSGKHAELWAASKNNNPPHAARNDLRNQLHGLQFGNSGKPQKGGNGKRFNQDMSTNMMGQKQKKTTNPVKFDEPYDEFEGRDSELSGSEEEDDYDDDDDDGDHDSVELDFGRRPPSRPASRGGRGQHGKEKKNGTSSKKGKGRGGGRAKKSGNFSIRSLFFGGFGRKKKSAARKKGGRGGGCMRPDVVELKNGKAMAGAKNEGNNKARGSGGNNKTNGHGRENNRQSGGGGVAAMGNYPVGPIGPMGNYPMGPMSSNTFGPMAQYLAASQMGDYQAAPAPGITAPATINGGYYPGVGPMAMNHSYMGMMMNQPPYQQHFNGMYQYHPTVYGRPSPVASCYAPHRAPDGYNNMMDDENENENAEGCSIM